MFQKQSKYTIEMSIGQKMSQELEEINDDLSAKRILCSRIIKKSTKEEIQT